MPGVAADCGATSGNVREHHDGCSTAAHVLSEQTTGLAIVHLGDAAVTKPAHQSDAIVRQEQRRLQARAVFCHDHESEHALESLR